MPLSVSILATTVSGTATPAAFDSGSSTISLASTEAAVDDGGSSRDSIPPHDWCWSFDETQKDCHCGLYSLIDNLCLQKISVYYGPRLDVALN
ncbi:hypothetical protein DOTSEDRAFT_70621 [Dothistroma septosporum NZE10]|uniref:Uncharacterized protein n=1 Tax=Dothistroma septosporum (strain NZE10 / CBS 128990) TaxID=675120 RepID=N1PT77_DOTSN|nr:hypothetical protein DOTSEDRAFT_70621 [Dothistroma septosporum NZE10]